MDIRVAYPPNIEAIAAALPGAMGPGVLFAYGNTIYNPGGVPPPRHLLAHEQVHADQQAKMGGPEKWWEWYISNARFRFDQELEAHYVELLVLTNNGKTNRHHRRACVEYLARRLSSPLYGQVISKPKVETLLRHALKHARLDPK